MSIEEMLNEPVIIKGKTYPRLIQGGMGAGVSLKSLAEAVSKNGGLGTLSSVGMNRFTAMRLGCSMTNQVEAVRQEVEDTKAEILRTNPRGKLAINIMCRLYDEYDDSVQGAVEGDVDMIISGAGLPTKLPSLVDKFGGDPAIVPIVSSKRALDLLLRRCWKGDNQYTPDAIVLEGPKAGGHLGWRYKSVNRAGEDFLENYDLFGVLLPEVREYLDKQKLDVPVFVAGGLWDKDDFEKALYNGASGIQVGTPFAACRESSANRDYKDAVIKSSEDDILIGNENWGSACGFPFRYLKQSPMSIKSEGLDFKEFCICTGLFATAGVYENFPLDDKDYAKNCPERMCLEDGRCGAAVKGNVRFEDLYTVGTNAYRVNENLDAEDKLYSAKDILQRFGVK